MSADEELGPLVRLWGIKLSQLPPTTATADELGPLLRSILQEAVRLLDSAGAPRASSEGASSDKAAATTAWKSKGRKTLAGSNAPVEVLQRTFSAAELGRIPGAPEQRRVQAETWIGRRSVHEDATTTAGGSGSASWAEFRDGLKDRHAEVEAAFTPGLVAHRRVARWERVRGLEVTTTAAIGGRKTAWGEFTLTVEEVRHRIGRPLLQDRVFAVLQVTAAVVPGTAAGGAGGAGDGGSDEFVVVNIPVVDDGEDEKHEAGTGQSNHHHQQQQPRLEFCRDDGVVVGAYVSVERVRRLLAEEIEWLMATASDARGVLPARLQALAVPGQVVKDVPWFLTWVAQQRLEAEDEAV